MTIIDHIAKSNICRMFDYDEKDYISDPMTLAFQMEDNIFGYYKGSGNPETGIYLYNYPRNNCKILILTQNFPMERVNQETFFKKYAESTALLNDRNGFGGGARATTFAITQDRTVWGIIRTNNGSLEYGRIYRKPHEEPQGALSIDNDIPNKNDIPLFYRTWVQQNLHNGETAFFYKIDNTRKMTVDKIIAEISDKMCWAMEDKKLSIKGYQFISPYTAPLTNPVWQTRYPILIGKLLQLRENWIEEQKALNQELEIKCEKSEPEIRLQAEGQKNWIQYHSHYVKACPISFTSCRSPVEIRINWDFFSNFYGRAKMLDKSLKFVVDCEKAIVEEVSTAFPAQLYETDEELTKWLQDLVDKIAEIEGEEVDPNPNRTNDYRYECEDCHKYSFIPLSIPPNVNSPTQEEKKNIYCGYGVKPEEKSIYCGSINMKYAPLNPHQPKPKVKICPNCFKLGVTTKLIEHLDNYTCPKCGYKEDKKPRTNPNSGIKVEFKDDKIEFVDVYPEQSLMVFGVQSKVHKAYGKDAGIYTIAVTAFQIYLKGLKIVKDINGHGLNALKNEFGEIEKNLLAIKNGKGRPKKA